MVVPWEWRFLDGWRGFPDNCLLLIFYSAFFRPIQQG
jgi:hypothetical protein